MNILRVISSLNPASGGPSTGIRQSIAALEKIGIINHVLSLDSPKASYIRDQGFTVFAIGKGRTPWCYNPALKSWLISNLAQYDIVIVHGLWQYHNYAVWNVINKLKKRKSQRVPKVYIMPHGMLDPYFQKEPSRRLKAIRNAAYWNVIESKSVSDADGILFTCEIEQQLAKLSFKKYTPKREICVGYGILKPPSVDEIIPDVNFKEKVSALKPYILFIGRIHPIKGIDNLIRAYKLVGEKGIKLPHLVIAGPGFSTKHGIEISKLALGNLQIHLMDLVSGSEKWHLIRSSEALIHTSHKESFGVSIVEALACGKPVLITEKVNIWKEVIDKNAGLVAKDTIEGAAELIENWLTIKSVDRERMSQNAIKCFSERFSLEINSDKIAQLR